MLYSVFTHGNALVVETPENLAQHKKFGWGTQITLKPPVPEYQDGFTNWEVADPGSWLHIPLTSTLTTAGHQIARLDSVTLLFETYHCRILDLHVWDGATLVQEFNGIHRKGAYLWSRDTHHIYPDALQGIPQTFSNTFRLARPHRLFSAVGISFYACAYKDDYPPKSYDNFERYSEPFPPAVLTVAAAGCQFVVENRFGESDMISQIFRLDA